MSGGLVERVVKTSHELVVRVSVEGDDDVLGVDGSEGCTAYLMLCRVKVLNTTVLITLKWFQWLYVLPQ